MFACLGLGLHEGRVLACVCVCVCVCERERERERERESERESVRQEGRALAFAEEICSSNLQIRQK